MVTAGRAVLVDGSGLVSVQDADGSMVHLTDIDPCKTWYAKFATVPAQGGQDAAYTVWQVLEDQPMPQLTVLGTGGDDSLLQLFILNGVDAAHGIRFDVFDITYEPMG